MNGTIKIIKIIIIWISVFLFGYVLNKSFNKLEGMTRGKPTSVYDQKVKYTSHDKHIKVTTPGANKLDTDVKKKIDMCDAINSASGGPSCDNLAGTDCGYCLDSDTAMYGDANGPIENVCQAKHWSPPGYIGFRSANNLHRVDLKSGTRPLTLFIPGPFGLRKGTRSKYGIDFKLKK